MNFEYSNLIFLRTGSKIVNLKFIYIWSYMR
jgi:hypothetical protein